MGERVVQRVVRRRRRRKPPVGIVAIVVILGIAVGIFGGIYASHFLKMPGFNIAQVFTPPWGGKPYVRILMLGEDNTGSKKSGRHGLSDTLVVLSMDTKTNEIRAISIPRDTRVDIPGHGTRKINSANVYGGPDLSRQVIQSMLGVDIDYYVATSPAGLRGLVNSVGGVWVKIDDNMHYNDNHQDLHINLHASPEKQLLNGQQAEGFVRFRHDKWGDSGWRIVDGKKVAAGRIARQQIFLRSLANRILAMPSKRERADVLSNAYNKGYIQSNLNLKDWDGLADLLKDIHPEKMKMTILPGAPGNMSGVSYWIPDTEKIPQVVAEQMKFEGGSAEDADASVEVLNGSGVVGAAGSVADKLKSEGFRVTKQGNAPEFSYDRCCLITRKGHTSSVSKIAKLLKCTDIRTESKGKGKPDMTVIVGRDYTDSQSM